MHAKFLDFLKDSRAEPPENVLNNVHTYNRWVKDFESYLRVNKKSILAAGRNTLGVIVSKMKSLEGALNNKELSDQKIRQTLNLMRDLYILIEYIKKEA